MRKKIHNIIHEILIVTGFIVLTNLATAEETDAYSIMKLVDDRYTGDTSLSNATLSIIDAKNRARTRQLKLFGLERDSVEKSLIFFMSPSDVKGTAYLSYDWVDQGKEDDSWLYLPALQKVKRVAAAEESGKFMGSDFSYADINGFDYEDYEYKILKQSEPVDGHDCWVIRSTPKNVEITKKTGYTGITSWIRKDIFLPVKSIIDVKKARRVKYFAAKDVEEIQGVWTAKTLQMVTTRNNKRENSSVITFFDIRYNEEIDNSMFDTQAMQRGI